MSARTDLVERALAAAVGMTDDDLSEIFTDDATVWSPIMFATGPEGTGRSSSKSSTDRVQFVVEDAPDPDDLDLIDAEIRSAASAATDLGRLLRAAGPLGRAGAPWERPRPPSAHRSRARGTGAWVPPDRDLRSRLPAPCALPTIRVGGARPRRRLPRRFVGDLAAQGDRGFSSSGPLTTGGRGRRARRRASRALAHRGCSS